MFLTFVPLNFITENYYYEKDIQSTFSRMGSQETRWRLRLHRDHYRLYNSLVASWCCRVLNTTGKSDQNRW